MIANDRLATLGIVIDADDAIRTSRRLSGELDTLGRSGKRVSGQVRETSIDLRAAEARFNALFGSTEKTKTSMAAVAPVATRTAASIERVGGSANSARIMTGRLTQSFATMAAQMTGVNPVIGRIAGSLAAFTMGSALVVGVSLGISAIAAAYSRVKGAADEAKKSVKEFADELAGLVNAGDGSSLAAPMGGLMSKARNIQYGQPGAGRSIYPQGGTIPVYKGSLLDMQSERATLNPHTQGRRIAALDAKITAAETQLAAVTGAIMNPEVRPEIGGLTATITGKKDKKPLTSEQQFDKLTGGMRDMLALQSAMKEARMNTAAIDEQIFQAYLRINAEIAKGVGLTNAQRASAISLRTALGGATGTMPAPVGITPMAGGNPDRKITVKGSNVFQGKDQYGNATPGMFPKVDKIAPAVQSLGTHLKAGLGDMTKSLMQGLTSVAMAMLVGGGGRGSQIGSQLGAGIGGAIGTGVGTWAGAKMGGTLGTMVMPGVGTAVGAVVGALAGSLFGGLFDKKKKVANGLDMMATQLNRVNQSLRNVPSGYKVARGQFNATSTDNGAYTPVPTGGSGRPVGGGGGGGGGGEQPAAQTVYNFNVMANSPQQLMREVERAVASVGTRGGPMLVGAF